jgi:predicted DNA-binding transcriptional regulator AlpA
MARSTQSGKTIVPAATPPPDEFLTPDALAGLLKVSKRTIFRLRAKALLPDPVEISTNIIRWRASDVRNYLDTLRPRKARPRGMARG